MAINSGNVHFRSAELCGIIKSRAKAYRTRHLLVPFGDDFKFKNAGYQFGQMDQLIQQINSKPQEYGCRIQYSTAHEYFQHVRQEQGAEFPVYGADFFPYADNDDSYWTGYYTTRPFMKAMHRRHATIMRSAEIMHALVRSNPNPVSNPNPTPVNRQFWENQYQDLLTARRDAALFLHHDAITGTSRGQVVSDYMDRMVGSSRKLMTLTQELLQHTLTRHPHTPPQLTSTGFVLEAVAATNEKIYPLVVHNNLAWRRKEVSSVRVSSVYAYVTDDKGDPVQAQVDPLWDDFSSPTPVANRYVLHFVSEVPALGARTYFVRVLTSAILASSPLYKSTKTSTTIVYTSRSTLGGLFRGGDSSGADGKGIEHKELSKEAPPFIQNALLRVELSSVSGLISSITDRKRGVNIPAEQVYAEYTTDRSGAYIFRPNQAARDITHNRQVVLRVSTGWITSTFSTRHNEYDVIGSLAAGDDRVLGGHLHLSQSVMARANQELVVRWKTKLSNGNVFATNNGLEWRRRTHQDFPLAANFLPAMYGCQLEDQSNHHRLLVGTMHSMGCASQGDGQLELMLHRSMNQDDGRGLAQAVVDGSRVDVPLIVGVDQAGEDSDGDVDFYRRILRHNNPMTVFYGTPGGGGGGGGDTKSRGTWTDAHHTVYAPMNDGETPLPPDVHVLTLAVRDSVSDDIILQLQSFGKPSSPQWSVPVAKLFSSEMEFRARHLRAVTASINNEIPLDQYPVARVLFQGAKHATTSIAVPAAAAAAATAGLAKQNTAEAGVFISKAALERSKQAAAAAAASGKLPPKPAAAVVTAGEPSKHGGGGVGHRFRFWGKRRLLSEDEAEPIVLGDDDHDEKKKKDDNNDDDDEIVLDFSPAAAAAAKTTTPPAATPKATAAPKAKEEEETTTATTPAPTQPAKATPPPPPPPPSKEKSEEAVDDEEEIIMKERKFAALESSMAGSKVTVGPRQLRSYVVNLQSSESPINTIIVPVTTSGGGGGGGSGGGSGNSGSASTVAKPMWGKQLFNSIFQSNNNNQQQQQQQPQIAAQPVVPPSLAVTSPSPAVPYNPVRVGSGTDGVWVSFYLLVFVCVCVFTYFFLVCR